MIKILIALLFSNLLLAKQPAHYQDLRTKELPILHVKVDETLLHPTSLALQDLHDRIGLDYVMETNLKDSNIYIHKLLPTDEQFSHVEIWGQAWLPNQRNFNGVVSIKQPEQWVIEHEILHVLGFVHSKKGLMQPNHENSGDMTITPEEIHYASLVRYYRIDHPKAGICATCKRLIALTDIQAAKGENK